MSFYPVAEHLTRSNDKATALRATEYFVHNMGVLASQTNEHIERMEYLAETREVRIHYTSGYTIDVDVAGDSWMQMVKDVFGRIEL